MTRSTRQVGVDFDSVLASDASTVSWGVKRDDTTMESLAEFAKLIER